jgi:hypothetical protein
MTGARGDAVIQAGKREVRLLFTNRALANAERQIGKSVIAVAQGFARGDTSIGDMAALLAAGMEAARQEARIGGRATTLNDAYGVMDAVGFERAAQAVMEAIASVLSYKGDDDGQAAAEDEASPNL